MAEVPDELVIHKTLENADEIQVVSAVLSHESYSNNTISLTVSTAFSLQSIIIILSCILAIALVILVCLFLCWFFKHKPHKRLQQQC